jgi:predicted AAA+ superfamily ATPase
VKPGNGGPYTGNLETTLKPHFSFFESANDYDEHNRRPGTLHRTLSEQAGRADSHSFGKACGQPPAPCDFTVADACVFSGETAGLVPVLRVNRVDIALLRGIDRVRDTLLANTERFAHGFAANNALLWGARGMGKSALVKSAHATVNARLAYSPGPQPLKLIEIHREDISGLPCLMSLVARREMAIPHLLRRSLLRHRGYEL